MKQLFFLIAIVLVVSCKKRKELYAIPDNSAQLEAHFPYKNIQKPLVFVNEFSLDSIMFVIKSKTIRTTKNTSYPLDDSQRIQSLFYNSIAIKATNLSYSFSLESIGDQSRSQHNFTLFNFWATIITNPVEAENFMAGRSYSYFSTYADTMTLLSKKYYKVYEVVGGNYSYTPNTTGRNITQVLFCESNGVIGLYDLNKLAWYFLKP